MLGLRLMVGEVGCCWGSVRFERFWDAWGVLL